MNISAKQSIDLSLIDGLKRIKGLVGNTTLYPITKVFDKPGVKLFAKLEWQQIGGSVKARAAYSIIKQAILTGKLHHGKHLLDATSGNTGIAYASICAELGLALTIVIPENASEERKHILQGLGAELVFTSKFDGTDGAQLKAKELARNFPEKFYYADQYNNEANWQAHASTTSAEIFSQTKGKITHFVAGLGTTGTFVGTSRGLLHLKKDIHLVALQPETALHGLEGWKHLETAKVPGIYDPGLAHHKTLVSTMDSYQLIKAVAEKEGLLLSPSSAANLAGAIQVANGLKRGVVVTVFPDNAEKYGEVINQIF